MHLGFVMDPIGSINIKKDSTFAMMLAAQRRGWGIWYMEVRDLAIADQRTKAHMRRLTVRDDPKAWFEVLEQRIAPLDTLDAVLMRKDPPFDMDYVFATHLLGHAEQAGCLVVNSPQTLRDCNEKLFTLDFPECTPPTLITHRLEDVREFLGEHGDIILKPLDAMGGASVFRVQAGDPNLSVIVETLTGRGRHLCVIQRFVPEIRDGDKRILMIDGRPVPFCLARIPAAGETRGNLAAGASAEGRPLSERDRQIAERVGPTLRERGVLFAGLDVIGDFLTEINITSPTCIRELDAQFNLDIAGELMDVLATNLAAR